MPELKRTTQQHPVPQNVMSVEFKLIGDLTVRQFSYLAVGAILVYIGFAAPLPFLWKWTVIIGGGLGGLALAFLPLQDRGLDQWVRNFIVAVSSPTQRTWRKEPSPPRYFLSDYLKILRSEIFTLVPPKGRGQLSQYLLELEKQEPKSELDLKEEGFLQGLDFDMPLPAGMVPAPQEKKTPSETPEKKEGILVVSGRKDLTEKLQLVQNIQVGRKLSDVTLEELEEPFEIKLPPKKALPAPAMLPPTEETVIWKKVDDLKKTTARARRERGDKAVPITQQPSPQPRAVQPAEVARLKTEIHRLNAQVAESRSQPQVDTAALKREIEKLSGELGATKERLRSGSEIEKVAADLQKANRAYQKHIEELDQKNQTLTSEIEKVLGKITDLKALMAQTTSEKETYLKQLATQEETLKRLEKEKDSRRDEELRLQEKIQQLEKRDTQPTPAEPRKTPPLEGKLVKPGPPKKGTPPIIPDIPNVINGIVKSATGRLLKSAMIIIKDQDDSPVRALKTNELGQFAISTPLPNDIYKIQATYPNENFDIIKIELTGQVLGPLEIYGRNANS